MKRAIISDIHGNLEALQAVLADARSQGAEDIICLGDIIGYGPNPCECLDLVIESTQVCLLGNHDQGALFDPEGFNTGAERAIFWTRAQLESGDPGGNERRWEFLGELPRMKRDGELMYVHGSARNPLNEYVFPEDIYNQRKLERIFGLVGKGRIAVGYDADFTVVDLKARWTMDKSWMASRCGWSPFADMEVTGKPIGTIIRGNRVMWDNQLANDAVGEPVRFESTAFPGH